MSVVGDSIVSVRAFWGSMSGGAEVGLLRGCFPEAFRFSYNVNPESGGLYNVGPCRWAFQVLGPVFQANSHI